MYLNVPSGGFKVVYEYANRLQLLGHQVTVIHPRNVNTQDGIVEYAKASLWNSKVRLKNRPLIAWFDVEANINLSLVPDLRERFIPDGDFIFATAYETAFRVAGYSPEKGKKLYLIQSYETWNGEEGQVNASWNLPLHKIVISRSLLRIAEELGQSARTTYIPIGLDFSVFRLLEPMTDRRIPRVGMLAHPNVIKGTHDGLIALETVKKRFSQLKAILFGTERRSEVIPGWVEYVQCPSQSELVNLYNSCQVFLNPSWAEGWGLPAAEAMACGCALVTADNGGASEFALDRVNALIVPIKRPELLAERVAELLSDAELRMKLATAGCDTIREFSWERAVDSLENLFLRQTDRL